MWTGTFWQKKFFFKKWIYEKIVNTREIQSKPSERTIYTIIRWEQLTYQLIASPGKDHIAMEKLHKEGLDTNSFSNTRWDPAIQSILSWSYNP